jgi:hypothetical protein
MMVGNEFLVERIEIRCRYPWRVGMVGRALSWTHVTTNVLHLASAVREKE